MRLGVVSPQTETGSDPAVIRDYAQAAEGAGYDHLLVFDHVLGGKLDRGQNWRRGAGGRPCRERRLPPVCAWALDRIAIVPEEAYLERKFGASYLAYKRRVRRWL
jgi:alkanesulfonate monooxygenase SsuD/methylene tetrahydromethanopterin reductase-like flavin-dependent oxidoreductase (luciferase family)